jgi:hypothetical protein
MDSTSFLIGLVVGLLVYAWFLRTVFEVPAFRQNQRIMAETLVMILEELKGDTKTKDYPYVKMPGLGNNEELNAIIASKIQDIKRRYQAGELNDSEYISEMGRIGS